MAGCTRAGLIPSANSGSSAAPSLGQFPPPSQGLESIPTPQHRLTTRISVPRHSASACRTNLFLILRCFSIVARTSFCLPITVEVPFKEYQGKTSSSQNLSKVSSPAELPLLINKFGDACHTSWVTTPLPPALQTQLFFFPFLFSMRQSEQR